jgi:hypothetical protein
MGLCSQPQRSDLFVSKGLEFTFKFQYSQMQSKTGDYTEDMHTMVSFINFGESCIVIPTFVLVYDYGR